MRRPLFALLLCASVSADNVFPRSGPPVEGKVTEDGDQQVVINPYFSSFKEVTWKIQKFERRMVARVDITPESPFTTYWRRMAELKSNDPAGALDLARWCKEKKLDPEAKEMASWALAAEPANEEAKAMLGAEAEKLLKSSPRHNAELRARIADYAALDAGARKAAYEAMKKDFGVTLPREWFDRVGRSMAMPKGYRKDVSLTLNSEKVTGVYTIHVPDDYDPLRPWPLVIGLHGGGPAGKDGKGVVGSGPEFYPFLDADIKRRGYIAVCPSAIAAPWASPENDPLFTNLLAEIFILFNIDLTRVYLIGHSMGGYGTWHFGPKYCEKFACIAPASGGGNNGHSKLADHGTAVYVYHSDNDPRCSVQDSREAAELLKKSKCDFIYTELPNRDHEFPDEIRHDMFDFFDRHRLMVRQGKQVAPPRAPKSSFLEKLTPDEVKYFPIASSGGSGKAELKQWLAEVSRGGGNAEKAAQKIVEAKDLGATASLAAMLVDRKTADDVRAVCAWTIGGLKDPKGVGSLSAVLTDDSIKVKRAAAVALGEIGEAKGAAPLAAAVDALGKYFDSRMQGKVMDVTDWEAIQDLNAAYVEALGKIGDAKTAIPVGAVSIRKILLSKIDVDYDRQVQEGPEPARRRAAATILKALPGLKEPKLKDALSEVRTYFADQQGILELADQAEAGLSGK